MDPITAGIVSGGANVAGVYMQNQANSAMAERQMRFQSDMSGTAHQREVADLRAAGLNPILSALGAGSSTPQGAMPEQGNLGEGISAGVNTAMAVRAQNKALESQDAGIANTQADTKNKAATANLLNAQTAQTAADMRLKTVQNNLLMQTLPSLVKKAAAEGDYAEANQLMGLFSSGVSSATDILGLKGLKGILTPKGKK